MIQQNLVISGGMVILTFTIHFVGLVLLSAFLRRSHWHPESLKTFFGQGASILFSVIMLFVLHSIEIWLYACLFVELGAVLDLEAAVYFSTTTFTTAGLGDVTLAPQWRLLAAGESMNGFLLIGWSTAFLVGITARARVFRATTEPARD